MKVQKITTIVLIAILSSAVLSDSPYYGWSYCDGFDDSYLHVDTLQPTVLPPVSGQSNKLTVSGHANQNVFVQHIHTKLKYGSITMWDGGQDLNMPFTKDAPMSHTQAVPTEVAPPGKYSGRIDIFDNTGLEVACLTFWFILERK
jgi:hypothetical protein